MRLLIICYHFPHFSEVKWPRATKEDCGRLENKTQISWLPVLSLCLFPEQPLGRQQSSVNYFVFIRVGIIVPFSPPLSQDKISSLVLNIDPSQYLCLQCTSSALKNFCMAIPALQAWNTDRKLISFIMHSLRWLLEPCWDLPRHETTEQRTQL